MTCYLALLRGINVGGNTKVPMKELRPAMEDAAFDEVATYLNSGNVLFQSDENDRAELANRLSTLIEDHFGTTTPVVLRTFDELDRTLAHNPFLDEEEEFKWLHVMFLDRVPAEASTNALDPERSPGDRFHVDGHDIYLHFPNGSGRSKLTIDYFERTLDVTATGRNWNTVTKLHGMMQDRAED